MRLVGSRRRVSGQETAGSELSDTELRAEIDAVSAELAAVVADKPLQKIERQLAWARRLLGGQPPGPRPGPFSMSLCATRELLLHATRPELASRVCRIERELDART